MRSRSTPTPTTSGTGRTRSSGARMCSIRKRQPPRTILARTNFHVLKEAGMAISPAFYATDRARPIQDDVAATKQGPQPARSPAVRRGRRDQRRAHERLRHREVPGKAAGSTAIRSREKSTRHLPVHAARRRSTPDHDHLRWRCAPPARHGALPRSGRRADAGTRSRPTALLELIVLKSDATFTLTDYLTGPRHPRRHPRAAANRQCDLNRRQLLRARCRERQARHDALGLDQPARQVVHDLRIASYRRCGDSRSAAIVLCAHGACR